MAEMHITSFVLFCMFHYFFHGSYSHNQVSKMCDLFYHCINFARHSPLKQESVSHSSTHASIYKCLVDGLLQAFFEASYVLER